MTVPSIEVTVNSTPIEVTVQSSPIDVSVASQGVQGVQGPPGQGIASYSAPVAAVQEGTHRWYIEQATIIDSVRVSVGGEPPTGADIIVDVNVNGSSIFTTQANRPRVLAGQRTGTSVPDITSLSVGSYLTVDIDQAGSIQPGTGLTVQVYYQ